jgi:pyruvate/2-oxoglutarate dehydrogenase complex dihydrolipoamide dehydrogenase (E3) component
MTYDAIIIGSGQAGTPLAFRLASAGQKVAFIEKTHLGGTCVNDGCTPTKAYVASARRMFDATHGEDLGIEVPPGAKANLAKIKARKDQIVADSNQGIQQGVAGEENITLFWGEARFTGHKEVTVGEDTLTAPQVFINVGGRARVPEAFQSIDYLTNTSILALEAVPEHLIVVGGSYLGLEFGQMFRRFGSRVTIIEKNDRLIHREDPETSAAVQEILEKEGIDIRLNADCLSGEQSNGRIKVQIDCEDGPPDAEGSHLLLAVGRIPNSDRLNLAATGLQADEQGYIPVNDTLETKVSGIYALGDVNGKGAFTHTSYHDFEIVAANLLEGGHRKVSDRILTYGLYIDPPLGRAGMTRSQAEAAGYRVQVASYPMSKVARAKEKGETEGFMQAVVDADTQKMLGAAVLGVGGDEIVASLLNVMLAQKPYTLIRDAVVAHPTVSELIPTIFQSLE